MRRKINVFSIYTWYVIIICSYDKSSSFRIL
nr:MAG TPA: hypothetical protein [Caudoviricetes sp.]